MNSDGALFAESEEAAEYMRGMMSEREEEQVRLMNELVEKERQALMDIPEADLQRFISMNRKERRALYKRMMRKRGRGFTK